MNFVCKLTSIVLVLLTFSRIMLAETYSVTQLPLELYKDQYNYIPSYFTPQGDTPCRLLNNIGQVVGCVNGRNAALWDPKTGLKTFESDYTVPFFINDNGFVAVQGEQNQVILWNPNNNEIKFGPLGTPCALNEANDILIDAITIWHSTDNTLGYPNNGFNTPHATLMDLSENGEFYTPSMSGSNIKVLAHNKNGRLLCVTNSAASLLMDGIFYYIPIQKPQKLLSHYFKTTGNDDYYRPGIKLNDNDEVVVLLEDVIYKWKKGQTLVKFPLSILGITFDHPSIVGFNNAGQILLSNYVIDEKTHPITASRKLILLTPQTEQSSRESGKQDL